MQERISRTPPPDRGEEAGYMIIIGADRLMTSVFANYGCFLTGFLRSVSDGNSPKQSL